MIFDAIRFLEEYNIPFITEGKNVGQNWIGIQCPLCNDKSTHGGFNTSKGYYSCWNCGWNSLDNVVKELLNTSFQQAKEIIKEFSSHAAIKEEILPIKNNLKLTFPTFTEELSKRHRIYLEDRGFEPDFLIRKYQLKGINHLGPYKFRIIAPIYYKNKLVSYQGRDITDKSDIKYKACRKDLEIINHQHILYNSDNVPNDTIVLVEGITDVWRLGDGAVATFGINYTTKQLRFIVENFKRVFILFDSEIKAQEQANKIGLYISALRVKTEIIELEHDNDPATLSQKEANYIMRQLLK